MKKAPPPRPTCDHCRKLCKAIVRNADGVWCSPKHHAAAMKLRAVAVDPELESVDIAGRIETALARRDSAVVSMPPIAPPEHDQILADWFGGKSPDTVRSYTGHLRHFAKWAAGHDPQRFQGTPIAIVLTLLRLPADESNMIVRRWINAQIDGGKAGPKRESAGIMARYRALRSLAKKVKRDDWVADAKDALPPAPEITVYDAVERYEGVPEAFNVIRDGLRELAEVEDAKPIDIRDWTIIRFTSSLGLRRIEVVGLDVEHVRRGKAMVLGKGRRVRKARPMTEDLQEEVKRWLAVRREHCGVASGPLFIGMHAKEGHRLTRDAVNRILRRRAAQFGVELAPHDLRRILCTESIRQLGPYAARTHTRHANVATLQRYDLAAGKSAAEEAAGIDAAISGRKKKR